MENKIHCDNPENGSEITERKFLVKSIFTFLTGVVIFASQLRKLPNYHSGYMDFGHWDLLRILACAVLIVAGIMAYIIFCKFIKKETPRFLVVIGLFVLEYFAIGFVPYLLTKEFGKDQIFNGKLHGKFMENKQGCSDNYEIQFEGSNRRYILCWDSNQSSDLREYTNSIFSTRRSEYGMYFSKIEQEKLQERDDNYTIIDSTLRDQFYKKMNENDSSH